MGKTFQEIDTFVRDALNHVIRDEQVQAETTETAITALQGQKRKANEELEMLLEDERRQPITHNHYHAHHVQKSPQESTRALIRKAMVDCTDQD